MLDRWSSILEIDSSAIKPTRRSSQSSSCARTSSIRSWKNVSISGTVRTLSRKSLYAWVTDRAISRAAFGSESRTFTITTLDLPGDDAVTRAGLILTGLPRESFTLPESRSFCASERMCELVTTSSSEFRSSSQLKTRTRLLYALSGCPRLMST